MIITEKNARLISGPEWKPIVDALAAGKRVQHRTMSDGWKDIQVVDTDRYVESYRVAPEPIRRWAIVYGDGSIGLFISKDAAESAFKCLTIENGYRPGSRLIEFQEIV